jgi:RimJ/RimL family protein N-acetyltransferase
LLETERLLLRRPRPDDVEAARLFERDLAAWLEQWELHGVGTFLVERRADGELVGRVGVKFFDGHPELGWTLLPRHEGNGYATEAARAVRDWYAAEYLISLIAPDNVRSERVAERLGARPSTTVRAEGADWVVWEHPR